MLPVSADMLLAILGQFEREHIECQPGDRSFSEEEILGRFDRMAI